MNKYEARWNHAFKWAKKLKKYYDTGLYALEFEGELLPLLGDSEIIINERDQLILIKCNNCRFIIYEGNLAWDHGAYTPIKEFKENVIDRVKLYKMESVVL